MKITFCGYIENNKIVTEDMAIERYFDPNELIKEYNNSGKFVEVVVSVIVSKKSNKLVTLVESITPTT